MEQGGEGPGHLLGSLQGQAVDDPAGFVAVAAATCVPSCSAQLLDIDVQLLPTGLCDDLAEQCPEQADVVAQRIEPVRRPLSRGVRHETEPRDAPLP